MLPHIIPGASEKHIPQGQAQSIERWTGFHLADASRAEWWCHCQLPASEPRRASLFSPATLDAPPTRMDLDTDPVVLNATAGDYARLLTRATLGYALWDPLVVRAAGQLGDCGQIRGGRFFKYFNILDDTGGTFPTFEFTRPRDESHIITYQVDNVAPFKSQVDIQYSITSAGSRPIVTIPSSVALKREQFAFLECRGPSRTIQEFDPVMKNRVEQYLIRNESQIRAALMGAVTGTIVILTKVVHTPAWVAGLFSRSPLISPPDADLGCFPCVTGRCRALRAIGRHAHGSDHGGELYEGAVPNQDVLLYGHLHTGGRLDTDDHGDVAYCVVVGTIQARASKRLRARMKSLLSCRRKVSHSSTTQTSLSPGMSLEPRGAPVAPGEGGRGGGKALVEADTPSDPLSKLIEQALDANPTLELVVARWDVITDFYKKYGAHDFDLETGVGIVLEFMQNGVATIVELVPSPMSPSIHRTLYLPSAPATRAEASLTSREQHDLSVPSGQASVTIRNAADYRLARSILMSLYLLEDEKTEELGLDRTVGHEMVTVLGPQPLAPLSSIA